jgi:hypothetical protein
MAGRQLHRLSALRVAKEVVPGHYADGGGLYMQIADSGARSWVFRFKLDGRVREMGLGPLSRVSLGEARKLATGYRDMVRDLIDPILARREQQRRQLHMIKKGQVKCSGRTSLSAAQQVYSLVS